MVSECLDQLGKEEPNAAEIVKLRFFTGLIFEEAGQLLGFTEHTAKRHWAFVRAWLYHPRSAEHMRASKKQILINSDINTRTSAPA